MTSGAPAEQPLDLLAMGKSLLVALAAIMPRAIGKAFLGGIAGVFLGGLLGLLLALGGRMLGGRESALPAWVGYLDLVWVPTVLAMVGGYVGVANGFLSALSGEVSSRGLGVRLFAFLHPALSRAVAGVRRQLSATGPVNAKVGPMLRTAVAAQIADGERDGSGGGLALFLARRSRTLLCLGFVRSLVTARTADEALTRVETLGALHTEALLLETLEDLFQGQMTLALLLGALAAFAPTLTAWFLR